jgi:hypothetical protein
MTLRRASARYGKAAATQSYYETKIEYTERVAPHIGGRPVYHLNLRFASARQSYGLLTGSALITPIPSLRLRQILQESSRRPLRVIGSWCSRTLASSSRSLANLPCFFQRGPDGRQTGKVPRKSVFRPGLGMICHGLYRILGRDNRRLRARPSEATRSNGFNRLEPWRVLGLAANTLHEMNAAMELDNLIT